MRAVDTALTCSVSAGHKAISEIQGYTVRYSNGMTVMLYSYCALVFLATA